MQTVTMKITVPRILLSLGLQKEQYRTRLKSGWSFGSARASRQPEGIPEGVLDGK